MSQQTLFGPIFSEMSRVSAESQATLTLYLLKNIFFSPKPIIMTTP